MSVAPEAAKLPPLRDIVWSAPLVPPAVAATLGLLADRYLGVPVYLAIAGLFAAFLSWLILSRRNRPHAEVALWVAVGFLAAGYHHGWRNVYAPDDVGEFAAPEPALVRVRGILDDEPSVALQAHNDPLNSFDRTDPTRATLEVREIRGTDDWRPASGKARLVVQGPLDGLHVGDEIEAIGWLESPSSANNPGEWDYAEYLRDQRIRAEIYVRKTPDAVVRLNEGWSCTPMGWLARLRGWAQRALDRTLPRQQAAVATALLLGENSVMTTGEWERYVRTGVIHVLAISGQHLVVLAWFLWLILKLLGVPRKRGALIVAGLLISYALLTGFRPPVQRAAVTVAVSCLALIFRRVPLPANNFALAWLVVIGLCPTDPFGMGCQLAFLQVALLVWFVSRLMEPGDPDPLDRLVEQSRSPTVRFLRGFGKSVGQCYAITALLGLMSMPLIASWQHLISLSGFVIGPPLILLTSIALISGFLLLASEAFLGGLLTPIFAFVTRWSLAGCDGLVDLAEKMPLSHVYLPDVPQWWLWAYCLAVLALLWIKPVWAKFRWLLPAGAGWVAIGALAGSIQAPSDELRVTFLAVGHGGCTVIETPDGRTLLYDAGALSGPEVTRRQVAPYLWRRGVRKIDELFLSHADLDHFNGVIGLMDRFDVGLITCTPSFSAKNSPGVQLTLAEIERRGVPVRIVQAGDRLTAGDLVMEVLHPPPVGPDGNENTRSLVLKLRHAGHTILLTGDLEGAGLSRVLGLPSEPVDVLMSPHHGSRLANTPSLAKWARPKLVVACNGPPRGAVKKAPDPYAEVGSTVWGTWPNGAVILHSHKSGLVAETFKTKQRIVVRQGSDR
ncbi:MAG: ComEC/Rec2 family competence protein [Gemmataceae bacterium]